VLFEPFCPVDTVLLFAVFTVLVLVNKIFIHPLIYSFNLLIALLKPHCTIDATKYFFSNRVISTWNNLPDMVVHSPTLSTFKSHLSVLDLSCRS